MKKLLIVLSVLAFFFMAGPVSADWVDDLKPLPKEVIHLAVIFMDDGSEGVVVLKTKNGICTEYKIEGDRITKMRNCNNIDWKDFVKK